MIPRETRRAVLTGLIVVLIAETKSQADKSYEESDWIPVTPAVPRGNPEKKASDRVLSLDAPAQRFVTNEDYANVKRPQPPLPRQEQQFAPYKKAADGARPRKIKYQPEYRFETPPPPPVKDQPQINYYNTEAVKPYLIEQPPPSIREQPEINYYNNKPHASGYFVDPAPQQPNYYLSNQQQSGRYVPVPSVKPQAPAVDAPSLYDQYNLPFNSSFYHSLNPTSINDELYRAINGSLPKPQEPVDVLYIPADKPASRDAITSGQHPYYNAPQQSRPSFPDKGERLAQIQQDFTRQALQAHRLQQQLDQGRVPLEIVTTTTTPKPKKRKPHQPPLAVFMESAQQRGDVSEVLEVLKRAKSIAVQDTISKNSPKIFIGPSNLDGHDGYLKFPLPYLNNVDGNRVEKKIDQLPFFVAPLSYKTPQGYSKIPLPSPHVGSVVVSTAEKPTTPGPFNQNYNSNLYAPKPPDYGGYANLQQNAGNGGVSYQTTTPNSFKEGSPNINYNVPYQSTTTERPVNSYNVRQPEVYNLQTDTFEQGTGSTASPAIEFNREIFNNQNYESQTVKPYKLPDILSRVVVQNPEQEQKRQGLPEINPLELAITEFELDQINNQYAEPNKKLVKHANAKGQTSFEYDNIRTSTSVPIPRGRVHYENQQTTERPQSTRRRGRTRPPSRTTTTPTRSTEVPDKERYTVLEEFVATQPVDNTYQPVQLDSSRRSSTPVPEYATYSQYLPQNANPLQPEVPRRTSTTESQARYLVEQDEPYGRPYAEAERTQSNNQYVLETNTKPYSESPRRNPQESLEIQNGTTDFNNYESRFENYNNNKQPENENQPSYDPDLNNKQFTQEISSLSGSGVDQFQPELQNVYQTQSQANEDVSPGKYVEQPSAQEEVIRDNSERLNAPDYEDHFINPFEDQAVRSLLASNLLVPSTHQQSQTTPTEVEVETPATSESPRSTTTPRSRGRQRGRQPSTSSPRRNVSRRRPSRPSATERVDSGSDYSSGESVETAKLSKPRFRTRGRPLQNAIAESSSTTENELSSVKQPTLEGGFEASFNKDPESYMRFTHVVEDQQIITAPPREEEGVKEYHQVYSLQSPSSTDGPSVVDMEIRHPSVEEKQRSSDIITAADEDEQYVHYNANIRAGGILNNNKNEETTRQAPRTRGRTRGRSRFASSTTARPATRTVSSTYRTTTQAREEAEFFGFIKTPNFGAQRPAEATARNEESTVQFVGEIRPKYRDNQEVPRTRTRGRTRPPTTNVYNQRQSDNEVNGSRNTEQITRRTEVRTRGRGSTHYRNPENVKRESDEDAENGNYPEKFLQRLEIARPTSHLTQSDDDQSPHASIHTPKILPKPEGWNQIESQEKTRVWQSPATEAAVAEENSEESVKKHAEIEDLVKLDRITTSAEETVETSTTRKPGRKRGVWKVIRHRVADPLETAESQNYQSVLNAFESIQKIEPKPEATSERNEEEDKVSAATSTESFFDAIYEMFDVFKDQSRNESTVTSKSTDEPVVVATTTSVDPTFPEEITEDSVTSTTQTEPDVAETTTDVLEDLRDGTELSSSTIPEKFEVEPWEMKAVKTSTSTEVSHETEICYKGRCVKSKGRKGYKHGIVK
ncbi:uncharacterized protein LOC132703886 [Cylas formicarius]|uniref:uncharacterized protein LOC132703886 n=1 Tax=Cylas formicarius TaxID=197179 RepID=UPI002958606C|nr:uncharacterized protein LOC132703886 [Cylas formicarius]